MTKIKKCPNCEKKQFSTIYRLEKFSILECSQCALRLRSMSLKQAKIKKLYTKNYFIKEQKDYFASCLGKINPKDFRIKDFNQRLEALKSLSQSRSKKLLDIGCATGTFIKLANVKGFQAEGFDISSYAVSRAKKQKLKVRIDSIESYRPMGKKFNFITAWEVIPNFENPNLAFRKIKNMLAKDGILAIQLTVIDSLIFYLSHLIYKLSLGKFKLLIQNGYPINHRTHFSRSTLKKFLSKHGFKIIKQQNIEFNYQYSKMPKIILPFLNLIGFISKKVNRTTQYRIFAKLK